MFAGSVTVAGSQVDFDPGSGVHIMDIGDDYRSFVVKLDTDGAFVWAARTGGATSCRAVRRCYRPTVPRSPDRTGNIYTTGLFSGAEGVV